MPTEYDEAGNYKYPDGFDSETQEWKDGFDEQRGKWEQDYAAAQARWESHKKQVAAALVEDENTELPVSTGGSTFSSESGNGGTLADDESLAALREKLSGNS
jgi:small subunit ribosomal protein S1